MNTADKIQKLRERLKEQAEITERAWQATMAAEKQMQPYKTIVEDLTHKWVIEHQKLDLIKLSLSMEAEDKEEATV